jgi:hypothetical protein
MPSPWSLLKAIYCLVKFADIPSVFGINIAQWLMHIHFLLKYTMKESIFHIQLPK